jgi:hypothetical protein
VFDHGVLGGRNEWLVGFGPTTKIDTNAESSATAKLAPTHSVAAHHTIQASLSTVFTPSGVIDDNDFMVLT